MFGRSASRGKDTGNKGAGREAAAAERLCRCEAEVPASVLDGFACGRADCWRTAGVKASFEGFVSDLVRARDGATASPDRAG